MAVSRRSKKKRPASSRVAELASRVGADEALTSLINQFSDPLSFLRELIQNSLDAASTRLDVNFSFEPAAEPDQPGLMTIAVTDNGEGMTERIIDDYLLTLFRSTKEDDLTKIGKFGVGFVSIFAMEPQLVLLETGQATESWRVLFHPDARFEKMRMDEPQEGTRVCLYRQATQKEFEDVRRRGHETIRFWCKYAEAELYVDGQDLRQKFFLDSLLMVQHAEPGSELLVGFAPLADGARAFTRLTGEDAADMLAPLCGFYNRGLTLVEAEAPPGEAMAALLAGLSFRVKSRYLEHTLTRDNVRQDAQYEKVMGMVKGKVDDLRYGLVRHLEELAAGVHDHEDDHDHGDVHEHEHDHDHGDDHDHDHDHGDEHEHSGRGPDYPLSLLFARLPSMKLHKTHPRARIFPTVEGGTVSFRRLRKRSPVLSAAESNPVTRLLPAHNRPVVLDRHGLVDHLRVCGLKVVDANSVYYSAVEVPVDETAQALLDETDRLLDRAWARVNHLRLGDLFYPGSSVAGQLFVRQEEPFLLSRHGKDDRARLLGGARIVVLNSSHPLVRSCLKLCKTDLSLAALLLAQAVAAMERISLNRALKMARASMSRAGQAPAAPEEER